MATGINQLLAVMKWPIAALALASLPAVAASLLWLAALVLQDPFAISLFFTGAATYWLLDRLIFGHQAVGSWFSTLEHEITHAIFAWGTFHRVIGMHVTSHNGGHVTFTGGGNWLIYIAPYWFPTLCVPIMVYSAWFSDPHPGWAVALGVAFMFHHLSTWRETHEGQTDLQETTFLFAWMFLPAANLIAAGAVIAFAFGHSPMFFRFLSHFTNSLGQTFSLVIDLLR